MSTDWTNDPEAANKALQEALENQLKKYPDRFLKEGKASGKKTFNGDKSPFYAIQAYVWCGMLYPDNDTDFEKKLPQSRFQVLEKVVPGIYKDTEDALVSVSASCNKFSSGPMDSVFSYSSEVKKYATNAKNSLGADDGLGAQLQTLTMEKYEGKETVDKAFTAAKELAKERLDELQTDAKEKGDKSDKLGQELTAFLGETKANQTQIVTLNGKYLSPVTDSSGEKYSNAMVYLNKDLEDLQKKLRDAEADAKKDTDELKEEENPKGWKFWVNVLGGPGAMLGSILDFKDAWEEWARRNKDVADVQSCQTTVKALESQIDELVKRMEKAIEGINLIRDNFRHLAESLDPLMKAIDKIEKGTSSSLLAIRKSNIKHGIDQAVTKYDEIIKEAEDFAKAAQIKVVDA